MDALTATAGLIAVGAITPGPNNLIVLRETSERGFRGALPSAAGILVGGLGLLAAVVAGAGAAFEREPRLAAAIGAAACLLLAALGLSAIVRSFGPDGRSPKTRAGAAAASFGGLLVFQFLNPKAWILVVAAVGSLGGPASPAPDRAIALAQLAGLFVVIPASCLALWSCAGVLAMGRLDRRPVRNWFDRLTGGLLIGFAALLLDRALEVF